MTIFIGSTNPVKVNAVSVAASETWPEVRIEAFEVVSGIPDQPIGDEETRQGAINRARAVLLAGQRQFKPTGDYLGVGLEGGVVKLDGEYWSTVWAAVLDPAGYLTESNGARFKVPSLVAKQIEKGGEMGPIMAKLIKEADVRRKQGMIGVITQGFIDRTEEYTGIIKMALGLWYGRNWADRLET